MAERFTLVFEGGPRAGERVPVSGDRFTLGRKPGNSLVIADASVSGSHCEIRRAPDGWLLKDIGSTNGTFFNGAKILEAKLRPGDRFAVGSVLLRFDPAEEGAAAAGAPPSDEIVLGGDAPAELELVEDEPASAPPPPPAPVTRTAPIAPPPPPPAPSREGDAGAALVTDSATFERARKAAEEAAKKSRTGGLVLAAVAVVALAGAGYFVFGRSESGGVKAVPVARVAGNLLEQASFEADGYGESPSRGGWDLSDSVSLPAGLADLPEGAASGGFSYGTRRVHSGSRALEAKLEGGTVARATTRAFSVSSGQRLTFGAFAAVGERSGAVVQAIFRNSKEGGPRLLRTGAAAFGQPATFTKLTGTATVPVGCNEMQLSLVAFGQGSVAFDDAEVIPADAAAPGERLLSQAGFEFCYDPVFGRIRRFDKDILRAMGVIFGNAKARMTATLVGASDAGGFTAFAPSGPVFTGSLKAEPGDGRVVYHYQVDVASAAENPALAWHLDRAQIGEILVRGKQTRWSRGEFNEPACSALVMGAQDERMRVSFDPPVAVVGSVSGNTTRLEIAARGAVTVTMQYAFDAERKRAAELETQADAKAAAGAYGEEIALRAQILDEFPFDKSLTERTENKRSDRLSKGQKLVADVERSVEDAKFFKVPDAFRKARKDAEALGASYAGTDIAERAKLVIQRVDESLSDVEAALGEKDAERVSTIARALEASGAGELAQYLRTYLKQHFPSTKAAKAASGG